MAMEMAHRVERNPESIDNRPAHIQHLSIDDLRMMGIKPQSNEDRCPSERWLCTLVNGNLLVIDDLQDDLGPYHFTVEGEYVTYGSAIIPIDVFIEQVESIGDKPEAPQSSTDNGDESRTQTILLGILATAGICFTARSVRKMDTSGNTRNSVTTGYGIAGHPKVDTIYDKMRMAAAHQATIECQNLSYPVDGHEFEKKRNEWFTRLNDDYEGSRGQAHDPELILKDLVEDYTPQPKIIDEIEESFSWY